MVTLVQVVLFVCAILAGATVALSCKPPVTPPPDASDAHATVDAGTDVPDATLPQDASEAPDATKPPPPPPDASTGDCAAACANLRALGCPEGAEDAGQGCTAVLCHAEGSGKLDLKMACVKAAKTKDELAKCGTVKCGAK
ncbi:MAG: hypothetical protein PVSMB8_00130 [Vulcanimicrobiaceae bacterium]